MSQRHKQIWQAQCLRMKVTIPTAGRNVGPLVLRKKSKLMTVNAYSAMNCSLSLAATGYSALLVRNGPTVNVLASLINRFSFNVTSVLMRLDSDVVFICAFGSIFCDFDSSFEFSRVAFRFSLVLTYHI